MTSNYDDGLPQSNPKKTVTLSRGAVRNSRHARERSVPLLRTESSGTEEDQTVEVPLPLASVQADREAQILHVDDEEHLGNLVGTFLERINDDFTVQTESSPVAALKYLECEPVDCVISDYQMPNMNGLEFLDVVRERYPDLPFILYTAQGNEEIASEAIAAGVTDYMQKDSGSDHYEVLANRVENAIEQHQTEQQFWNALTWYQRLVEQELAGVCIVQQEEFVYVNRKFADVFGYRQEELVGDPVSIVMLPNSDAIARLQGDPGEDSTPFELEFVGQTRDGSRVKVELSGGSVEYDDSPAWIGVLRGEDA